MTKRPTPAVVLSICLRQMVSLAVDSFRARENIVGMSGLSAGFIYQQRKGE